MHKKLPILQINKIGQLTEYKRTLHSMHTYAHFYTNSFNTISAINAINRSPSKIQTHSIQKRLSK